MPGGTRIPSGQQTASLVPALSGRHDPCLALIAMGESRDPDAGAGSQVGVSRRGPGAGRAVPGLEVAGAPGLVAEARVWADAPDDVLHVHAALRADQQGVAARTHLVDPVEVLIGSSPARMGRTGYPLRNDPEDPIIPCAHWPDPCRPALIHGTGDVSASLRWGGPPEGGYSRFNAASVTVRGRACSRRFEPFTVRA
jgi:hypothetical protein